MQDAEIPKPTASFALFGYGFRPFFLLAGGYAVLSIAVWAAVFMWGRALPSDLPPSLWHAHEMLFGFSVAAAAGFLMTAVPSWTGTPRVSGAPLAVLVIIWLAGRVAFWMDGSLSPVAVAIIDMAFIPALIAAIAGPIIGSGQKRNFLFPGFLLIGVMANGFFHAEALGWTEDTASWSLRLTIYVFVLMVALIGGRITPRFTANALKASDPEIDVRSDPRVEKAVILSMIAAIAADLAGAPPTLSGALALAAAIALGFRMRHWHTARTLDDPIVWVLHLGHAWVPFAFACKAAADIAGWLPADAALHAFTTGAIGTTVLAVMTRAGLGHTGRPLLAPKPVVTAYLLVTVAALARIFGPVLTDDLLMWVVVPAGLWIAAFGMFTFVFAPILIGPRPDGKPG
ncbi:MAG: NnrS family protein [Rhodospirillales bacterium]|nr:NnrS family protein [Rhodospirillales bacterium]